MGIRQSSARKLTALFVLILFISSCVNTLAADVSLAWDASISPNVTGYKVYVGNSSRAYGTPTSIGNQTTYTVTGLGPGTYYFAVTAFDGEGNESDYSNEVSQTISDPNPPTDSTPPVISAVSSSNVTVSSAAISWTTNEAADTQVEYGTTTAYGNSTTLNPAMVTAHSQGLTGLTAGTLYHYRVRSRDAAGNLAVSADFTFTTAVPPPDTTPPVISGVVASGITSIGATISWTTNEAADTQIEYGTSTGYGSSTALSGSRVTAHSQQLSGLAPSTVYHYRVKSKDASGNLATSTDFVFTTAAPPDTTPPVISGVSVLNITHTGATISWTTNEASNTQVEYGTTTQYGSSTTLSPSMVVAHSAAISGLTENTTYHYRVRSRDAAGNLSVSDDFSFTTAADTTAPVISNVAATNLSTSGATITWTTDEAADSQVEYGSTAQYGNSTALNGTRSTEHSVALAGLTAGKLYHYRVRSRDAAGNLAVSGDRTFTASADSTPPVISGVASSHITTTSATISWTTSEPADTQVEFGPVPKVTGNGSLNPKSALSGFKGNLLAKLQRNINNSRPPSYSQSTPVNASLALSHSQVLTGLASDTLYHYRVLSRDAAGNLSVTGDYTFMTRAEGEAPVISNVAVSGITSRSATISWTTDKASDSEAEYWASGIEVGKSGLSDQVTEHSLTLNNLEKSTQYSFRVQSTDAEGNQGVSEQFSFTTAADSPMTAAVPRFNPAAAADVMVGVALTNSGASNASLSLSAVNGNGSLVAAADVANPKTESLGSGSQVSLIDRVAFGSGMPNTEGWIRLESSSSDVNGFFLTFDGNSGFMDGASFGAPLKHFAFTATEPQGTRVNIANANAENAAVTFELVNANGGIRSSQSRTIPANGALVADLYGSLFSGITPEAGDYVRAASTVGVQPFALMRKGAADIALLPAQDTTAGKTELFAPLYMLDPVWKTTLSVVNMDARPGMVTFRYIGDDGVQIGQTRAAAIAPNGRVQIDDPEFFVELDPGMTASGYVEIESDGIRIAGSMGIGGDTFSSALPLTERLATTAVFSHVASSDAYFMQLAVVNPDAGDAAVTVELHAADGRLVASSAQVVPAGQRIAGLLTDYFPSLVGQSVSSGYIRVVSDRPVAPFALVGTTNLSVLSSIPPR